MCARRRWDNVLEEAASRKRYFIPFLAEFSNRSDVIVESLSFFHETEVVVFV